VKLIAQLQLIHMSASWELANMKQRPAERFDYRGEPAGEAPLLPQLSQGLR